MLNKRIELLLLFRPRAPRLLHHLPLLLVKAEMSQLIFSRLLPRLVEDAVVLLVAAQEIFLVLLELVLPHPQGV